MRDKTRRFLHTFFRIFIIFLLVTAAINLLLLGFIILNNKSKLKKEAGYLVPTGHMVEVNGHNIHVYVGGNEEAETTLVFLHSGKVVDDSVALQPLFKELSDYRVVYVDRSGFGFSENSGSSRDIETILEETRLAIKGAGVEGHYTLVSIGTSGIEAFHWANKYASEVDGIIGINMNYPEQFAEMTTEEYCGFFDYWMVRFYAIGGQRLVSGLYPANPYGIYNEAQMQTRKALISKGGYTEDMYQEDLATVDNAALVAAEGFPKETDMYLIYANPLLEPYLSTDSETKEIYESNKQQNPDFDYVTAYNQTLRDYFSAYENVTIEELAGPARLYTYDPKSLANTIAKYLE